jgi:hypothetical protein
MSVRQESDDSKYKGAWSVSKYTARDMADIGTGIHRRPTTEPSVWWAVP